MNYLCYFLNQNTAYNTNIFSFQSIILYEDTPEFNGFNTRAVREQGILPSKKTSINYDQLINGKPSNPSTVYTALLRMKKEQIPEDCTGLSTMQTFNFMKSHAKYFGLIQSNLHHIFLSLVVCTN